MADDKPTSATTTARATAPARKSGVKKPAPPKTPAKASTRSTTKPKAATTAKRKTPVRKTAARKASAKLPAVASGTAARNVGPEATPANTPAKEYLTMATEKASDYATEIKGRASDAVSNVGKMIEDAAALIDDNIGAKYGDYARNASRSISEAAERLRAKDVSEIGEDTREFVRKRPAVAAGIAAIAGLAIVQTLRSVFRSRDN